MTPRLHLDFCYIQLEKSGGTELSIFPLGAKLRPTIFKQFKNLRTALRKQMRHAHQVVPIKEVTTIHSQKVVMELNCFNDTRYIGMVTMRFTDLHGGL